MGRADQVRFRPAPGVCARANGPASTRSERGPGDGDARLGHREAETGEGCRVCEAPRALFRHRGAAEGCCGAVGRCAEHEGDTAMTLLAPFMFALLMALSATAGVSAHESQPATLDLRQVDKDRYEVIWRAP